MVSVNIKIQDQWEMIIPPQFIKLLKFKKAVVTSRQGLVELNIYIDVLSSAIIFVKYQVDNISFSISLLTGYEKVNIIFHQVSKFICCHDRKKEN